MTTKLICTIGPSCEKIEVLEKLKNSGVNIFRINLSHASIEDVSKYYEISKKIGIDISIDTEGAQLRTKNFENCPINFQKDAIIKMNLDNKISEENNLNLTPKGIIKQLKFNDHIRLDFNGVIAKVIGINPDNIELRILHSGFVGHNKGADCLGRNLEFDDFTAKDLAALELSKKLGISRVFISFCQSSKSIAKVKKIIPNCWICCKIESRVSIHNLPEIANAADAILIDRGDLSREISILDIPFAQRGIIKVAQKHETPCYVATNVLESLIDGVLPTRAELNDIVSSLEMGCSGIVLAAETAIGKKPVLCAEIIKELIHKFYLSNAGLLFCDIDRGEITDEDMIIWLNRYGTQENL